GASSEAARRGRALEARRRFRTDGGRKLPLLGASAHPRERAGRPRRYGQSLSARSVGEARRAPASLGRARRERGDPQPPRARRLSHRVGTARFRASIGAGAASRRRTMKSAWRVMKFGGTTVGTPSRLAKAAALIREAQLEGPVAVVVSAMGD